MKKLIDIYNKAEEYLLFASLIIMVLVVFMQVISRNMFSHSFSWVEELARYIFIWQVWIGASIATRKSKHIRVEFIFNACKGKLAPYALVVSDIIWFLFCLFLAFNSTQFVLSAYATGNVSAAMRIPVYWVYMSIPIGVTIMAIRLLAQMFGHITDLYKFTHQKGVN